MRTGYRAEGSELAEVVGLALLVYSSSPPKTGNTCQAGIRRYRKTGKTCQTGFYNAKTCQNTGKTCQTGFSTFDRLEMSEAVIR